jgi:hypothetical protein
MEPKPKTMNEALDRLRDTSRISTFALDLADALEILVILGKDSRDLDRDVTDFRG